MLKLPLAPVIARPPGKVSAGKQARFTMDEHPNVCQRHQYRHEHYDGNVRDQLTCLAIPLGLIENGVCLQKELAAGLAVLGWVSFDPSTAVSTPDLPAKKFFLLERDWEQEMSRKVAHPKAPSSLCWRETP